MDSVDVSLQLIISATHVGAGLAFEALQLLMDDLDVVCQSILLREQFGALAALEHFC